MIVRRPVPGRVLRGTHGARKTWRGRRMAGSQPRAGNRAPARGLAAAALVSH